MFSVLRSSTDLLVATLLVLFAGQLSAQEARKDATLGYLKLFSTKMIPGCRPCSNVEDHVEMARNAREHTVDLQVVFK